MKDFRTREQRLKKMGQEAHFELADSDDFFGFDGKEQDSRLIWLAIIATAAALFLFGWVIVGNAQQECLERNEGNITLCE